MGDDMEMSPPKPGLPPPSSSGSNEPLFTTNHAVASEVHLSDTFSHAPSRGSSITDNDHEKNEDPEAPKLPLTRQSTELGQPIVVPRLKRRGLLGQLALVAEIENAKTYSRNMKWFITSIVALAGILAPLGSSIFFRKLRKSYCIHSQN